MTSRSWHKTFSELDKEDRLLSARELRDEATVADSDWLRQAQRCYAFKAGDQWGRQEKHALELRGREPMSWNYIHPVVELVVGVLSQNPVKVVPNPVEKQDGFLCEVIGNIIDWVNENQTESETEHEDAFEDSVITGKGYVNIDFEPRPENPSELRVVESSVPVHQLRVDPASKKPDLSDARYVVYEKWITIEDFRSRYPQHDKDLEEIFADSQESLMQYRDGKSYAWLDDKSDYDEPLDIEYYDPHNKRILLCCMEYFESYKRHYWFNPVNPAESKEISAGEKKEFPASQVKSINDKKVRWLHFIYDRIVWEGDSPVYKDGFSTVPMFAYVDKSNLQFDYYGIVKNMIDPQREANKRWMQTIHLMQKQGLGVTAELGAPVDLDQFEDSWNDPDQVTWVNDDALRQRRIQEKTQLAMPAASMTVEEQAQQAMKMISGVNPDMLGFRDKEEPGIVVKLRQQQGLTILQRLFRNYRRMKKMIYKRKMHIITKYMPDWQIQKILGETEKYAIKNGVVIDKENGLQAPIRAIRDLKYNISLHEAPGNMTKNMAELSIFMDMMKAEFPVDPKTVIDKLDLAESEKMEWKKYIDQSQKSNKQMQQMQMKLEQQSRQAEIQEKMGKLQIENQKLQGDLQIKAMQLKQKASADQVDDQIEMAKIAASAKTNQSDKQMELAKMEQNREQTEEENEIARAKAVSEIQDRERDFWLKLSEMDVDKRRQVMDEMENKLTESIGDSNG